MIRFFLSLTCVLLGVVAVSAQTTAPITGEVLTIYRQGQSSPAVTPITLSRATRTCGLPATPAPSATVPNPLAVRYADPASLTLDCQWLDPGNGVLAMLAADPAVVYEATLRFNSDAGATPESVRSNLFTRPGAVPASPARVRVSGS